VFTHCPHSPTRSILYAIINRTPPRFHFHLPFTSPCLTPVLFHNLVPRYIGRGVKSGLCLIYLQCGVATNPQERATVSWHGSGRAFRAWVKVKRRRTSRTKQNRQPSSTYTSCTDACHPCGLQNHPLETCRILLRGWVYLPRDGGRLKGRIFSVGDACLLIRVEEQPAFPSAIITPNDNLPSKRHSPPPAIWNSKPAPMNVGSQPCSGRAGANTVEPRSQKQISQQKTN
jgi:hypothetical protein